MLNATINSYGVWRNDRLFVCKIYKAIWFPILFILTDSAHSVFTLARQFSFRMIFAHPISPNKLKSIRLSCPNSSFNKHNEPLCNKSIIKLIFFSLRRFVCLPNWNITLQFIYWRTKCNPIIIVHHRQLGVGEKLALSVAGLMLLSDSVINK